MVKKLIVLIPIALLLLIYLFLNTSIFSLVSIPQQIDSWSLFVLFASLLIFVSLFMLVSEEREATRHTWLLGQLEENKLKTCVSLLEEELSNVERMCSNMRKRVDSLKHVSPKIEDKIEQIEMIKRYLSLALIEFKRGNEKHGLYSLKDTESMLQTLLTSNKKDYSELAYDIGTIRERIEEIIR